MSTPPDDPRPGARRQRRNGPLVALGRWIGLEPRGERPDARPADDASQAALDLMDQAEAFQSLSVADVMTPRADVTALELSASFAAVVAAFAESEHSRLPVYRETLDDPVGVAHLKDVFKRLAATRPGEPEGSDTAILAGIRREALYVPPSMRAADLLVRMQSSRIHMAMVIDEFGGMDGVVTLEDVIEAVVGEIDDEHDEAAAIQIVARAGGILEIDGRLPLDELETAAGLVLTTPDMDEDIDTAAGLVSALAGRVPQRGEVIAHPEGLEFEITDADPRRVKRLRLRPAARGPAGNPPSPSAEVER